MRVGLGRAPILVGLLACGCAGRVQESAKVNAASEDDRRWETSTTESSPEEARPATSSSSAAPLPIWAKAGGNETARPTGIVHGLSLKTDAAPIQRCSCVRLAAGRPDDPRFVWRAGAAPDTADGTIAIAIAADECPPSGGHRPSIAGIEREGDDVILVVEDSVGGRPLVRGALTARPGPGGAVVVRAKGSAPFGSAGDGSHSCRLALDP